MDKKFKLKINVFDVIIILLVIVAGFVVLRLMNADGGGAVLSSGTPVTVRYTLELHNMPEGLGAMIHEGDSLSESVEKRAIGTVVGVEITPTVTTSKDSYSGDFILADVPNRETATLTVEISAYDTGTSFDASGFILRSNDTLSVTGPGYACVGLVTGIER